MTPCKKRALLKQLFVSVIERSIQVGWQLRVFFTEDVFASANLVLKNALADTAPRKVLILLDESLALAQPKLVQQIENYFSSHAEKLQLAASPIIIAGGERAKNSPALITEIHAHIDRHHIDRHSYLIAVGGGALLDVAGFAAATAHRGVRHVRIPTTTLAQADSRRRSLLSTISIYWQRSRRKTNAPVTSKP